MSGIVAAAAVAHADVEITVRPERQVAAVVVGEGLDDEPLAAGPHEVEPRCSGRHASGLPVDRRKLDDDGVAGRYSVK